AWFIVTSRLGADRREASSVPWQPATTRITDCRHRLLVFAVTHGGCDRAQCATSFTAGTVRVFGDSVDDRDHRRDTPEQLHLRACAEKIDLQVHDMADERAGETECQRRQPRVTKFPAFPALTN